MKKMTGGQWFCLIMTVLMLALTVVVYYADSVTTVRTQVLLNKHKQGVGQLTETAVTQTFTADAGDLCGVDVMASTYNKKVKQGSLTLWLTDESDREIARQEYPVDGMRNNAFLSLEIPLQRESAGKTYTLHAVSDCVEGKGVTLRMGPADELVGTLTLADGTQTTEDTLNIKLSYEEKHYSLLGGGFMLLLALCFAAGIPLNAGKEKRHA